MADGRVFLVDGTALVYRAHFALIRNPMTTRGEPMAAVFGFATALVQILQQEKPDYLGVAFDMPGPTFRHERYPEYKAHRPPMPEEIVVQLPKARRLTTAIGARVLEREGVEADDLIGTMAQVACARGLETVIVSGDKDFMQLVGPHVRQWIPPGRGGPGEWIDAAAVRARWGVGPEGMIDLLALMGDTSDNVPGVKGIGPKTAAELLDRFGTLDGIYQHLPQVGKKAVAARLEADRESAYLSRELVTISCDLDPPCALEDLRVSPLPPARPELLALLDEFEFRQLRRRVGGAATPAEPATAGNPAAADTTEGASAAPPPAGRERAMHVPAASAGDAWEAAYRTVTSLEDLDRILVAWRGTSRPLGFDTETMGLDPRRDALVGLGLGWEPGTCYYLPIGHAAGPNLPWEGVAERLAPILSDPSVTLVGQNVKFDLHVLGARGLVSRCRLRDTLLAAYLDDPDERHDLDSLSLRLLGHTKIPTTALIGSGRERTTMDQVPVDRVATYCGEDVDAALRLHTVFEERLRAGGLFRLWTELECPLVRTLLNMEQAGVFVDTAILASLSTTMEADLRRLEKEIQAAAGEEFNVNAPRQLEAILFDRLGLPSGKKTKTARSTDQDVLDALAPLHPVPRLVLEYRELAKLKGTYLDSMPSRVDPRTGRIHASFNQAVAATGRLSSSDPNLQNIPVRTERGRALRRAFAAAPGHVLLSADYSQVELRLLAHFSGDAGLREAFLHGVDVHAATAATIFGIPADRVDASMRSRAKTINFGVIYGMGAVRLARELSIPLAEARAFISTYFERMPGVRRFQEETLVRARREGLVRTISGRRRPLRGINGGDARVRAQAERMAINTPIQGSAADLIKQAMLEVEERLRARGLRTRMILQVHDELVLEAPQDEASEVAELLREAMEGADRALLENLAVPAGPVAAGASGRAAQKSVPAAGGAGLFDDVAATGHPPAPNRLLVPLKVDLGSGANWDEAHA